MEPEGSLSHSHVPATCPYPDPDQSSPDPHIPLPEDPSYTRIILPSTPGSSLSLRFLTKHLYAPLLFPIRTTCSAHLISRFEHPDNIVWGLQIIKLLIM
jgi:hypothetical protein